jgi:hypothetical protein
MTVVYTSETNFLGIWITDSLKWHSHFQFLVNKLSKVNFMIKSLKEILSSNFIYLFQSSQPYMWLWIRQNIT